MARALGWAVPLAVTALILTPFLVIADPTSHAHGVFAYSAGSAFSGDAIATCAFRGFGPPPGPQILEVHASESSSLEQFEFEGNYSVVNVPAWRVASQTLSEDLRRTTTTLEPGSWRIATPSGELVFVLPSNAGSPGAASSEARLELTNFTASPPSSKTAAFTYWIERNGDVAALNGGPTGNHRMIASEAGNISFTGDVTIYVGEGSILSSRGNRIELPPHSETSDRGLAGHAALRNAKEHFAFWQLRNATFTTDSAGSRIACADMSGRLEGTLTAFAATGTMEWNEGRHLARSQPVTMAGTLEWNERLEGGKAHADVSGPLRSLAVDFRPIGLQTGAVVAQATFWAGVAAALAYLATHAARVLLPLFTRITASDVLNHPRRRQITEFVTANPDCSLSEIIRGTGIAKPVVRHHVRILESQRHIRSYELANGRCYVGRSHIEKLGRAAFEMRADVLAKRDPVLATLVVQLSPEPVRMSGLLNRVSALAGVSRISAWKAVRRAQRFGLLERSTVGREVWLRKSVNSSC